jgi:hypothetical protein
VKHGIVAKHQGRRHSRQAQESFDFRNTQGLGQAAADFRGIYIVQGIDGKGCVLLEEKKKSPQCRQSPRIGTGADPALVAELEIMLDLLLFDALRSGGGGAGEKSKKGFEIGLIGCDSIPGEPTLNGQVLQEKRQVIGKLVRLQKDAGRRKNKSPEEIPSGRSAQTRLLIRLNLRSLRRASAAFRRFLTLGFS